MIKLFKTVTALFLLSVSFASNDLQSASLIPANKKSNLQCPHSSGSTITPSHDHEEPEQSFEFTLTEMTIESKQSNTDGVVIIDSNKQTEFTISNLGKIKHEVLFGRGAILREGLLIREYNEHFLENIEVEIYIEGIEVEASGLKEIELDPGKSLRIVFTPKSELQGDWEIGCFLPGHYEMGMKIALKIR